MALKNFCKSALLILWCAAVAKAGPVGPPGGSPIYNQSTPQNPAQFNVSTGTIRRQLTVSNVIISSVSPSLPLQVNSSSQVVSQAIDLSGSQVTGNLGMTHLGSGTNADSSHVLRGDAVWVSTGLFSGAVSSVSGTNGITTNATTGAITVSVSSVSLSSQTVGILPVASGGTGTSSPGLVAGANIASITGSWPNQTINATTQGGGGASSLAVTTGTSAGFNTTISTPTGVLLANGAQFIITSQGGATAYMLINTSSITALGPTIDLSNSGATEVVNTLGVGNGGTGFTIGNTDTLLVGNGTTFTGLNLPTTCSGSGKALTYSPASGSFLFSCNSGFVATTDSATFTGSETFNGSVTFSSGVYVNVTNFTASTTLTSTHTVVLANCASACTVTLPTAVGLTGKIFKIKSLGAGAMSINTTSSQTIDGSLTVTPSPNQYADIDVVSDGSNWSIQ